MLFVFHILTVEQWDIMTSCWDLLKCRPAIPNFKIKLWWVMNSGTLPTIQKTNGKMQLGWVKKLHFRRLCVKIMLFALFDFRGLIQEEFVPSNETINAEYYEGVMDRLLKQIARVCLDFHSSNAWFLLHDNVPAHNAVSVHQFLAKNNLMVIHHPLNLKEIKTANLSITSI